MNPSRSRFCEGPDARDDDPLPIHLRRYVMQSSKDSAGWNVGILDGGIGEASVLAGGVFHTEIPMVRVLPPFEPNRLYHAVICVRNKSYCLKSKTLVA